MPGAAASGWGAAMHILCPPLSRRGRLQTITGQIYRNQ